MKNFKSILFSWMLLLSLMANASCKKEDGAKPAETEKHNFVSAEFKAIIPVSEIRKLATSYGYAQFTPELKYDITVFSMIYKTTYQGKEIQASGLLCFPRNMPTPPAILSAQHGTLFAHKDAPSNFPLSFNGPELFASAGYATFIPDYIGYGASKDILHPYYNQQYSALAVIDMIKAGKYFSKTEDIPLNNDKLFLAGYSEGGYVTLAAQKEIESNPSHGLKLTAVAAGAGGYDLVDMLSNITTVQQYSNPSYLAFLTQAFNTANGWNRPTTDFFKQPYAGQIPTLLNGTKGGGEVNAALPKKPSDLFAPAFFSGLAGNGETLFKNALVANSLTNWTPKAPTRLYHGTADEVVPATNSQTTYNKLKKNGAANLEYIPIPGGTHSTAFQPMIISLISWFPAFK